MNGIDVKNVLVTGGLGYIGAHTCVELLSDGFQVVIVDNLSNSRTITLSAIEQITGKKCFLEVAHLQDLSFLETVLKKYECSLCTQVSVKKELQRDSCN